MSMVGGRVPAGREDVGQTVAEFPTYEGAQKAVSALIAGEVPARDIAIVGQGLRSIERVTGRLGYATAARSGAVNGLLLGLLFSAIFVLGTPSAPIQAFVGVMFIGIAVGMLLSIITFAVVRRRRDFASVMQVAAERYEVTVADGTIQRARQVLGREALPAASPAAPSAGAPSPAPEPWRPTPSPSPEEPPRYGERLPVPGGDPAPGPDTPPPAPPAPGPAEPPAGEPGSVSPGPAGPVPPAPGDGGPQTPGAGLPPTPGSGLPPTVDPGPARPL